MSTAYDAIIIGTGQAGPPLAGRLTKAGMKVAIVERNLFGGTCVNTGCIPTKAMVASAYAARMAQRAAEFGVDLAGTARVDMKRVKARKDDISAQSRTGLEKWLRNMENCTVYDGQARFESARDISVGEDRLTSERIFINVGGRAVVPLMPGLDETSFLTNSSMMQVDFLPRHLIVVGGSYIGLEFGQMFRRFGSEVTILEMSPRLVQHEDEDVSAAILEIVRAGGHSGSPECQMHRLRQERRGDSGPRGLRRGITRSSRVARASGRGTASQHGRPWPGKGRRTGGPARLHRGGRLSCDPAYRVSGRWAIATARAPSPIRLTTISKSSRRTCSTTTRARSAIASTAYALYIDPPLGRAGMTDAQVREVRASRAGRESGR